MFKFSLGGFVRGVFGKGVLVQGFFPGVYVRGGFVWWAFVLIPPEIRLHSVLVLICSEAERPLKFQGLHTKGGTSISGGRGGVWTSNQVWRKIWGKVRPSSPNKRKNLGSSVTTRCKSWEKKSRFWGLV